MLTPIERARRYLEKCPPAVSGQGGHNATFHVAAVLVHGFALSETEALALLQEWNAACLPPWTESELIHKIRSAAGAVHSEVKGHLLGKVEGLAWEVTRAEHISPGPRPRAERVSKPMFKPETLKRIAQKVSEINDVVGFLAERSPVRVDTQDSASVLRRLYARGSGERVLVFSEMKSQGQFVWESNRNDTIQNRDLPAGPEGVWFLPQPVTGEFVPNPRMDGKLSRRSEEAVTAWRYAVLESDEAATEDWLRCLVQMPLRIACICESGGRSIHALVQVDAASKADWDSKVGAIKPILITLGADRGALSAVRLTRLPQARRGERVQRLLYLNPGPDGTAIHRRPKRVELCRTKLEGGRQ